MKRHRNSSLANWITAASLLLVVTPAAGQDLIGTCLNTGGGCTANDLDVGTITITPVGMDTCTGPGDTITLQFDVEVIRMGGGTRYDIGVWIPLNGNSPTGNGICQRSIFALTNTAMNQATSEDADDCLDITGMGSPVIHTQQVTVNCVDADVDGTLDPINIAVSWDQGSMNVCSGPSTLLTGTDAKCEAAVPVAAIAVPTPTPTPIPPPTPTPTTTPTTTPTPAPVPVMPWVARIGLLIALLSLGAVLLRRHH